MSCFVISEKMMNDTLNFIYHEVRKDNVREGFSPWLTKDFCDYLMMVEVDMKDSTKVLNALAHRIYTENTKSYNVRYPDHDEKYEHDFYLKYNYNQISIVQFLKNLDCIDYQSCEVLDYYKDNESLFNDIQYLRKQAINVLDGYKQAAWGY